MKKRQLYMIELAPESETECINKKENFIKNFQTAILLSLLEENRLTKWQFDCCIDQIDKKA